MMRFFFRVSLTRAIIEALLVGFILLIGFVIDTKRSDYGMFFINWLGILSPIICCLRARIEKHAWRTAWVRDGGSALLFGTVYGFASAVMQVVLARYTPNLLSGLDIAQVIIIVLGGITFFMVRMVARLAYEWNTARQKRLRWSITHAHLMTAIIIVVLYMVYQALHTPINLRQVPEGFQTVGWSIIGILMAVSLLILNAIITLPVLGAVMILAAIVSYMVARQITGRIELLAQATSSLRGGNYTTRIVVQGADEITQLQHDFNMMAADLEVTMNALKQERDTVAGLLQTRRELVASVSHELRTPVATIRGYLESALGQWGNEPPGSLRRDLEVMGHEVIRLQALIDDLFALSRAEVGKLTLRCEPVDVKVVVQQVVEATAPLAWDNGRVRVLAESEADLPLAMADGGRLEQILRNLIQNSIRHTPPGGIVIVRAGFDTDVFVEVQDTGEGIAAEDMSHIWDRFYRGGAFNDNNHHAGLGLALVKELSEAMGAKVAVTSRVGEGSRFRVCLPLMPKRDSSLAESADAIAICSDTLTNNS
jgi:signal transduction histidine kinase